jgi:hypothetical protein
MEYGMNISNPLLQTAVSVGESTIRHACDLCSTLRIHVEMEQAPDGREAVKITLRSQDAFSGFRMPFRKYFDHSALRRVARHAWQRRVPCGHHTPHLPAHWTRNPRYASMN